MRCTLRVGSADPERMRVGTCPATAIAKPRWRGAQQAQEAGDPPLVNKAEERCSTPAILNLVFSLFLLRLRYRALFIGRLRGDQLPCLFGTLLGESCRCYLFDGLDDSRDRLAEALDIKGCDEVRQRPLPRLLVVIGELAELFWVQPELTGHLHMRMRQAKSLSGLDPWPQADWNRRLFLRHRPSPECLKRQSMSVAYGESRRSDAAVPISAF